MRVALTVSVRLLVFAVLAFVFLSFPVLILAQEKPDPLIQPSPVPWPQQAPQQPNIARDEPVLVNTDLISFNVTVTDTYGRFVSGLSKKAFAVYDDKEAEDIAFFSDDDAPLSIGIVFDLTGSMSADKVKRAKGEYFLITPQGGRAFLTLDRTRDSKAILEKLTFVQTKGNTAFYDGVYLATEKVQRGAYPKRVVLVISDGQDTIRAIPSTICVRC